MVDSTQLAAWQGDFGNDYVARSAATVARVRERTFVWAQILKPIQHVLPRSVLEVGSNVGINLRALQNLIAADYFAVEPNAAARQQLIADKVLPPDHIFASHAGKVPLADRAAEMCITSGVLIHIAPDNLLQACNELHRISSRYIACIEYFSDQPVSIDYRGQKGLLFKRDFGAYWLDNFQDLRIVDYGFLWRNTTGIDNSTWWLLEKK